MVSNATMQEWAARRAALLASKCSWDERGAKYRAAAAETESPDWSTAAEAMVAADVGEVPKGAAAKLIDDAVKKAAAVIDSRQRAPLFLEAAARCDAMGASDFAEAQQIDAQIRAATLDALTAVGLDRTQRFLKAMESSADALAELWVVADAIKPYTEHSRGAPVATDVYLRPRFIELPLGLRMTEVAAVVIDEARLARARERLAGTI